MLFKENEFDLVICKDVLHHCDNPKKAIKEIKRVGKDYIIIEAKRGDKWLDYYLPGHHHFTLENFKELVNPNQTYFLDILWPRIRLMPFFLLLPRIPKSKNSFMVGTSYEFPKSRTRQ
jgi:ubiquinone/menaquinone biosynthesis C-methylase UbiE